MQRLAVCTVIASVFWAATTLEQPAADEVVLLQTRAEPLLEQRADTSLLKTLMAGLRLPDLFGLAKEAATPAPSEATTAPPALQMSDLAKVMADAAQFMPSFASSQQQQAQPAPQMPDFGQVMKEASMLFPSAQQAPGAVPDLAKIAEGLAKLSPAAPHTSQTPDLGKIMTDAAMLLQPAAGAQQVPDLSKILMNAVNAAPRAASAPQALSAFPDLTAIAEGLAKLKSSALPVNQTPDLGGIMRQASMLFPAAGNLQQAAPGFSAMQLSTSADIDTATAYFIQDYGMVCIQGAEGYLAKSLAKLQTSPLGESYRRAAVRRGTCADQQYTEGPTPDKCLPQAVVFTSKTSPSQPWTEPLFMSKYAKEHGVAAMQKGMADLCTES